jgi:hypothetical protein
LGWHNNDGGGPDLSPVFLALESNTGLKALTWGGRLREPEEEVDMMHIEQQSPSTPSSVNGASQTQTQDSDIVPTQLATQETLMGNGASPTQTQETIVATMTAASQLDSFSSQSGSDNDN